MPGLVSSNLKILFYGHLWKERPAFWYIADAQPGPFIHGQIRQVGITEDDLSAAGGNLAHDNPEQRRFSGSVRSYSRDSLFFANTEADLVHDGLPVISTRYPFQAKQIRH